ncbi:t-SNARE [Emericellopsis atlantica]|uniref:t-SNARE affecting a late Golgi compartment protein 1 n=1 Tax=Emericellopsis atlantica TaxID=2614577 RepID=A0A9P7ZPL0_9HYPO|nr:t-SNARE [Emericellopsis atlantica]KAG9255395.1 t-SNARE [Emericellopsis atlantica]
MMSSTNEEDPFLQVQQDVLSQLSSTRSLFTSYLRIRSLTTSSTSPELASAKSDLEAALETLAEDLEDLQAAVQAVESNPSQFGLSQDEVTRRKRFVGEVGGEIDDMKEEAKKTATGGKAAGDLPDPNSFAIQEGDDGYEEFEQQQQVQMMRDQDEQLDGVSTTVGNLRRQADDMGRELEEQRQILEVVDDAAERVGGRLSSGMQKLNHIVRQNEDRWSSCCIGVLIFALILLLVLLLIL